MSLSKIVTVLASASMVAGHAYISGIVANEKQYVHRSTKHTSLMQNSYTGYIVDKYAYMDDPPDTIGWSTTATDLGFVKPDAYQTPDIICHEDAKPGALTAPVKAGSDMQLEWTTWPESHHGPLITYLASCNGDCANVDKSTLKFFKIGATGVIDDSNPPGVWASDKMIDNNGTWTVTIPKDIANGNYVLRNEIIALHSAANKDGAQNYPQCVNVKVTNGGSASPSGTKGTSLYQADAPGILVDIYSKIKNYVMPGPPMYNA